MPRGAWREAQEWMTPDMVFRKRELLSGNVFPDPGCGSGDYSLYAALPGGNGDMVML
jgi:hypothetical protein